MDVFNEADDIILAYLKQKELKDEKSYGKAGENELRQQFLENTFIRLSSDEKIEFIKKILQNITSDEILSLLLSTIYSVPDKLGSYLTAMPDTNLIYDKSLADHNRMLEGSTLMNNLEEHTDWFLDLPHVNQYKTLVVLLRIAGGSIMRKVYPHILKRFNIIKSDKLDAESSTMVVSPRITPENASYDPNHPISIKVELLRKQWDDTLSKYQKQVEKEQEKLNLEENNKKDSDKKEIKSGKNTKNSSKSKKNKKTKSEKSNTSKSNKKNDMIIDQIQVLPIWIVKKILGYIDDKNLKKYKSVNSYWNYVIEDIFKDRKARKLLDKQYDKLISSISPEYLQQKLEEEQEKQLIKPSKTACLAEKRLNKLEDRGAAIPGLKPKIYDPYSYYKSIHIEPIQLELPIRTSRIEYERILTLPRILDRDNIYKREPCLMLTDMEIRKFVDEEITCDHIDFTDKEKMFDTKLTIEETAVLEDW